VNRSFLAADLVLKSLFDQIITGSSEDGRDVLELINFRLQKCHVWLWPWRTDDASLPFNASVVPVLNEPGEIVCTVPNQAFALIRLNGCFCVNFSCIAVGIVDTVDEQTVETGSIQEVKLVFRHHIPLFCLIVWIGIDVWRDRFDLDGDFIFQSIQEVSKCLEDSHDHFITKGNSRFRKLCHHCASKVSY